MKTHPLLPSHLCVVEYLHLEGKGAYFWPLRWSLLPCEADVRRSLDALATHIEKRLTPHLSKGFTLVWTQQEHEHTIELECCEYRHDKDGWGDTSATFYLPPGLVCPRWLEQWKA